MTCTLLDHFCLVVVHVTKHEVSLEGKCWLQPEL